MEHILTLSYAITWLSSQFLAPIREVEDSTPDGVTGGASRKVRPWGQAVLWDLLLGLPSQVAACKEGQSVFGLCGHCAGGRARSMWSKDVPPLERGIVWWDHIVLRTDLLVYVSS
jgi:hypothetical protein